MLIKLLLCWHGLVPLCMLLYFLGSSLFVYYLQVRIDRGIDLQSLSTAGLYPCGEGAGYAGGIVSAAVDGMKIAQAILQDLAVNTY